MTQRINYTQFNWQSEGHSGWNTMLGSEVKLNNRLELIYRDSWKPS